MWKNAKDALISLLCTVQLKPVILAAKKILSMHGSKAERVQWNGAKIEPKECHNNISYP